MLRSELTVQSFFEFSYLRWNETLELSPEARTKSFSILSSFIH